MISVDGQTPSVGADSIIVKSNQYINCYYVSGSEDINTEENKDTDNNTSNPEYKDAYNKVVDPKVSEKEVVKLIGEVTDNLNKKVDSIKSEKDSEKLVDDVKDISCILEIAVEKVNSKDGVKNIAKESTELVQSLVKVAEKVKNENKKKEIATIAEQNIDMTLNLINKIEDEKEVDSITNNVIESTGDLIKNLSKENTKDLNKKVVNLANEVVNKVSVKNIENNIIKADEVEVMAEKIVNKANVMNQKLSNNNIENTKSLEKKLIINLISKDKEQAEVILEEKVMNKVLEKGLYNIKIKTNIASFNLTPNTFEDKDKEIILQAKE